MEQTIQALKLAGKANDAAVLQAKANRLALESSAVSILRSIRETENSLSALLAVSPTNIERGTLEEQQFPDTFRLVFPYNCLPTALM